MTLVKHFDFSLTLSEEDLTIMVKCHTGARKKKVNIAVLNVIGDPRG